MYLFTCMCVVRVRKFIRTSLIFMNCKKSFSNSLPFLCVFPVCLFLPFLCFFLGPFFEHFQHTFWITAKFYCVDELVGVHAESRK